MQLFEGEREIMSTNGDILTLTTHRVRIANDGLGQHGLVSITLDAVASCGITSTSHPWLLGLAAVVAVLPFIGTKTAYSNAFWIAAGGLVVIYLLTRVTRLTITSAGEAIATPIKGMNHNDVVDFVDALEKAKLIFLAR